MPTTIQLSDLKDVDACEWCNGTGIVWGAVPQGVRVDACVFCEAGFLKQEQQRKLYEQSK